ncbi:hypothetical protein D3C76_1810110 [compost metagenome]
MDKVRKLVRILNKEHRRVVADEIKNAFFGIEFGGETANITHGVGRTRAALNRRKTHKDRGNFVRVRKEVGFGDIV